MGGSSGAVALQSLLQMGIVGIWPVYYNSRSRAVALQPAKTLYAGTRSRTRKILWRTSSYRDSLDAGSSRFASSSQLVLPQIARFVQPCSFDLFLHLPLMQAGTPLYCSEVKVDHLDPINLHNVGPLLSKVKQSRLENRDHRTEEAILCGMQRVVKHSINTR